MTPLNKLIHLLDFIGFIQPNNKSEKYIVYEYHKEPLICEITIHTPIYKDKITKIGLYYEILNSGNEEEITSYSDTPEDINRCIEYLNNKLLHIIRKKKLNSLL